MTKFTLVIHLGNDAMQTEANIADALLSVAGEVRQATLIEGTLTSWKDENLIRDANGNTVGYWSIGR